MKTEDEVRAQRDWFWTQANALESEGDYVTADAFAVLVGALDWVLDDFHPDLNVEVTDED